MAGQAQFEICKRDFRAGKVEYGWRFRAANGEIIATSGEGFTRKEDARRAAEGLCDTLDAIAMPPCVEVD